MLRRGRHRLWRFWRQAEGKPRSLFHQPFGHVCIGDFYLFVTGAGVGELFTRVSIVQVLPDGRHLFGDVEASVLLGHNLGENTKPNLKTAAARSDAK